MTKRVLADLPTIVLAGGFGTRLRSVVSDVPKPMAPVGGRPFLDYVLMHLHDQGIRHVILSTGYLGDKMKAHYGTAFLDMRVDYSHEETPLGTGGAVRQAMEQYDVEEALLLNGDTYFPMDYGHLYYFHQQWATAITVGVREMHHFDRYGAVSFDAWNVVQAFHEKKPTEHGWINAGTYIIDRSALPSEEVFGLEEAVLSPMAGSQRLRALPSPAYFIDIGVPDDYTRFDQTATSGSIPAGSHGVLDSGMFLDRDGVINVRTPGDYVRERGQFVLLDGAIEAISRLQSSFERAYVVTNQQGVGKGLMTREALDDVHAYFQALASEQSVHFDGVFAAEGLAHEDPPMRKPKVGMALAALGRHPELSFVRSVMVGDSTTDIEFGLRTGMYTILVADKSDTKLAHHRCKDLKEAVDHVLERNHLLSSGS